MAIANDAARDREARGLGGGRCIRRGGPSRGDLLHLFFGLLQEFDALYRANNVLL